MPRAQAAHPLPCAQAAHCHLMHPGWAVEQPCLARKPPTAAICLMHRAVKQQPCASTNGGQQQPNPVAVNNNNNNPVH